MKEFKKYLALLFAIASIIISCNTEEVSSPKITGMSIKTEPAKIRYHLGEKIDLEGLIVTVSYDNSTSVDIGFEDFENKGIMCLPESGSTVTPSVSGIIIKDIETGTFINKSIEKMSVTDGSGKFYLTTKIGDQVWMAENLKTTKFQNGDLIPTTETPTQLIKTESAPIYQWTYGGNSDLVNNYGRLYTGVAVTDERKICPVGWHLPSDAEWDILKNHLGGEDIAARHLKVDTFSTSSSSRIETWFSAVGGGIRYAATLNDEDYFMAINETGYWWTSTYSNNGLLTKAMSETNNKLATISNSLKHACSVRCLKD